MCLVLSCHGALSCCKHLLAAHLSTIGQRSPTSSELTLRELPAIQHRSDLALQLAIFWVSTSYLAAGIFLAPMISGREPRGQNRLRTACWVHLTIVVFGSLSGEYAGIEGWFTNAWLWFGNQGFEYLDLGPVLANSAYDWVVVLGDYPLSWSSRATALRAHGEHALALLLFSSFDSRVLWRGLLANPGQHFTTTDFWRFWVVHLWVEDFLELFTTIMVAYVFVLLGVVHERIALRMIYLDMLLYSAGGIIGTMHHVYFSGEPAIHMALGAFFSAAEVIPLTFLTVEAWSFLQLGAVSRRASQIPVPPLLGCDVPGRGRLLELPWGRDVWLSD